MTHPKERRFALRYQFTAKGTSVILSTKLVRAINKQRAIVILGKTATLLYC